MPPQNATFLAASGDPPMRAVARCNAGVHGATVSIASRLTLALTLAAVVLFGAVGSWQLHAEERDLRSAVERDLRFLGRALQVAFENALRDRQSEDVEETLRELERLDPEVDVFVYDAAGAQIAASTAAVDRPRWISRRPDRMELEFVPASDPRAVELMVPLRITRDERAATLVVVRPLDAMRADLEATRERVLISVAGFVLVVALLSMLLARHYVSTPLARMNAQMARVRAGDLSPAVHPARDDEVGRTLQEFGSLVRDLGEARSRLDAEAEARRRLEDALRELDKLATVGQLAAGLAHEIGSPLQILEGRIAALETKADDPSETRRIARILLEQTRRITRIVMRLTDVARRRTGRVAPLDVGPPVRAVVELLEGEARRRGVKLTIDESPRLPSIHSHGDSLQQLALNLLRNALEATERGGRVELRLAPASLEGPEGAPREAVRIEVVDTGRGMDEETRARALEPLFTTRASAGGTGLGLAVVKGIVDEHRGRIEIQSEVGRGTAVRVDLPRDLDGMGVGAPEALGA